MPTKQIDSQYFEKKPKAHKKQLKQANSPR